MSASVRPVRRGALLVLVAVLLVSGAPRLFAQATDDADVLVPEEFLSFLEGALTVSISARIVDQDNRVTVWNLDLTRVTVGGRSVSIRLDGSNVTVVAEFTPYWESDDSLMLEARGETWLHAPEGGDAEYRTAFTTLPIRLGEPIIFLPLGTASLPVDTERFGRLNIELEINVERYQS